MNSDKYEELYKLLSNEKVNLYSLKDDLRARKEEVMHYKSSVRWYSVHYQRSCMVAYKAFENALSVAASDAAKCICDELEDISSRYQRNAILIVKELANAYLED